MTTARNGRSEHCFALDIPFMAFSACVSLVIGLYLCSFLAMTNDYWAGKTPGFPYTKYALYDYRYTPLIAVTVFLAIVICANVRSIPRWIIKHRYALAALTLILCCALEINQSSVGMWAKCLGEDRAGGTLFGIPRSIRSDEWLVTTPLSISQVTTGNQAISPIIRGGNTDVTFVQALPSWSLTTLFHPFYWGYLILGKAGGVSFFWIGRLIALMLTTYEVACIITRNNKPLSVATSILVSFAPSVQWWGAHTLLIFGQALVVALWKLVQISSGKRRWLMCPVFTYLFCCYIFELYPAWQVPFFYIFALMGISILYRATREKTLSMYGIMTSVLPPLVISLLACAVIVACSAWFAKDAIEAMLGTVYPGQRGTHSNGGLMLEFLKQYIKGTSVMPISTMVNDSLKPNVCVISTGIALCPLGLSFQLINIFRRKSMSGISLVMPYILFLFYAIWNLPDKVSQITLLNNVPAIRLLHPMSYLDAIMLVQAISVEEITEPQLDGRHLTRPSVSTRWIKLLFALVLSTAFSLALVTTAFRTIDAKVSKVLYLLDFAVFILGFFVCMLPNSSFSARSTAKKHFILMWSLIVLCVGLCINPIQRGIGELVQDDITTIITSIVKEDPEAIWIGDTNQMAQACVSSGAKTLNSINSYPNLELWHRLDPDGSDEDIYNRYAHIDINLAEETSFTIISGDRFAVNLNEDDFLNLDVDYWLSRKDLTLLNSDKISFIPIGSDDGITVFKVVAL